MADLACQQMVELVTDYLEGALRWRTRRRFERHLRACDGCDRYIAQMRVTLDRLGEVPVQTVDEEAMSDLLTAFRDFKR